ncbi:ABC transporter ATP-binding protein [Paenibacillus planticolens]|uniref:ATP-binding cassette domain-containing protein n=1 Tax=Paenibacillus planticolens TaxID=2654976 RepID=A0ABX1ZXM9_9BACL|nr:ATP-binding cassette domain-containing protein [Paenibacillus planticolens]NOV04795.1 ATP-binding cassette domain-containing protein [Paenibacillus planticolens]
MLLEGKNLGFRYGRDAWIFRGMDIALKQGEVVGLVGPSGCGKTTLGRLIAGYELPHEGSVQLNGSPPAKKGFHPVQLVFQHPEKAVNPRWPMHRMLNEGWQPDADLLRSLGIEKEWLQRWPNELSGGELQRFCIARALGPETRFLIADEMTTMLDAITQAQIWHAVLDIAKERNLGVLVISHERKLIQRLCSRVIEWNGETERSTG